MAGGPERVVVLLNPSSGMKREGAGEDDVRRALEAAELRPEIVHMGKGIDAGEEVAKRVRDGVRVVVAAGGDGTVSCVGAKLAGTESALGILPTGTLNHLAVDLGIPSEIDAAARVIAGGTTLNMDVGEVNGRVFLNNSSIGLYPMLVSERERCMEQGAGKRLATWRAAMTALWRFPNRRVRLTTGRTGIAVETAFVFVGNNEYEFEGWEAGTRASVQEGRLQLCTVAHPSRWAVLQATLLSFAGRAGVAPHLHTEHTDWLKIETSRRRVSVALDGEAVRMETPLTYTIRPGALRVIVPGEGKSGK